MLDDQEAPHRLRRPILVAAAAAAVVAVAITGLVVTYDDGDHDPDPAPAVRDQVPTPSSTGAGPTEDVARQLRDFARGDGDLPPVADEVGLYLGNAFTGFVTRDAAQDRRAWETCTEVGGYAGRSCPLSPLDVLQQPGRVEYVDAPQGRCLSTYGPLPPVLRRADRTTIVPAPQPDPVAACGQGFAVQTFTDGDGDLVAVSLLLGER